MRGLRLLRSGYDFVRSPTGQRLVREVGRQVADPRFRRRVVALGRWRRSASRRIVVVDADPPP